VCSRKVRIPPVFGLTAAEADVAPATITVLTASALAAVITTARRRAERLLIDVFPFIRGAKSTPLRLSNQKPIYIYTALDNEDVTKAVNSLVLALCLGI
jgi:hypothetical protein